MKYRMIVLALLLSGAQLSWAATIIVTSDSGGHNVMDACVLRDAITQVNTGVPTGGCGGIANSPDPATTAQPDCVCAANTILLPQGRQIMLSEVDDATSNTGLPTVTASLEIDGNNTAIYRDPGVPCNHDGVNDPGEFALIASSSPLLILDHVYLLNGCADSADYQFAKGGAITNYGTLVLRHSALLNNWASNRGGGLYTSGFGAGAGSNMISDSNIINNGSNSGGGIFIEGSSAQVTIVRSLFESNSASQYFGGGAIEATFSTTMAIVNSTFAMNTAGSGAAIDANGIVAISSSTIAENVAGSGGAFQISASGTGQLATIKNSLFAANSGPAGNCAFASGSVTLAGNNLSTDASCTGFGLANAPAALLPLLANGGPTRTYALQPASAAVDAATDCTDSNGFSVDIDARGSARPIAIRDPAEPRCDIGAYELGVSIFSDGFEQSGINN